LRAVPDNIASGVWKNAFDLRVLMTTRNLTVSLVVVCWSLLAAGSFAWAEKLPAPQGDVILTVDGDIANTTDGTSALFDRAMLESLGMTTLETTTPWTDGVVKFEGVPARKLLEAVGSQGESIEAAALNDYISEIPAKDFADYDVILALRANGVELTVRDKGPIFIVYPLDSRPELNNEDIYSRCVWQLTRLTVK
jgi:hypothetical protein